MTCACEYRTPPLNECAYHSAAERQAIEQALCAARARAIAEAKAKAQLYGPLTRWGLESLIKDWEAQELSLTTQPQEEARGNCHAIVDEPSQRG